MMSSENSCALQQHTIHLLIFAPHAGDKSKELVHLFISDIGEEGDAVGSASDIADAFISFSKDPTLMIC